MGKATFPATSQAVSESIKPADSDGFVPGDHRNAYSAIYQGDLSPLRPRANNPADLFVNVAKAEVEGFFRQLYANGNHVTFAGGNSPSFTVPTGNPRIDLLVLDVSGGPAGTLTRIAGTEAASPVEPALPDLGKNIPVCYVYNRVGQTKIVNFEDSGANPTQGYIYRDVRPWALSGAATSSPQFKRGNFSRDMTLASGVQSITGVGFQPDLIFFFAARNAAGEASVGISYGAGGAQDAQFDNRHNAGANQWRVGDSQAIRIEQTGNNNYVSTAIGMTADGFDVTWLRENAPTGTIGVDYFAIKH